MFASRRETAHHIRTSELPLATTELELERFTSQISTPMSHFTQHYAQLHDEDLIQLALKRELLPEALEALNAELKNRGIRDLSAYRAVLESEVINDEADRQAKISHQTNASRWGTRFSYGLSAFLCLEGAYRFAVPSGNPGDNGLGSFKLGISLFVITLAVSWLRHLWRKHVLYRRAPP